MHSIIYITPLLLLSVALTDFFLSSFFFLHIYSKNKFQKYLCYGECRDTIDGTLKLTFSNSSLSVHAGILVGTNASCGDSMDGVVMQYNGKSMKPLQYTISGDAVIVEGCLSIGGPVRVNPDTSTCFLYGPSGLPAPPLAVNCTTGVRLTL